MTQRHPPEGPPTNRPPRPRVGRLWRCAALAACMLAVAGCGTRADRPPSPLSKQAYIQHANELQRSHTAALRTPTGRAVATPALAAKQLQSLDELIAGFAALRPPREWRDEHATMLRSLRSMRGAMAIIARSNVRQTAVIRAQIQRYVAARRAFQAAVQKVNATR